MARIIEVPICWKNGSGSDICIELHGIRASKNTAGNGYIWDVGTPDGCETHLNISYDELRQLIIAPGEFASYRDLTPTSDVKTPPAGWQPIETAPRDGTFIDIWTASGTRLTDCRYDVDGAAWNLYARYEARQIPTHWMPIPAGPEVEQ